MLSFFSKLGDKVNALFVAHKRDLVVFGVGFLAAALLSLLRG